jgi:hypothetical protein
MNIRMDSESTRGPGGGLVIGTVPITKPLLQCSRSLFFEDTGNGYIKLDHVQDRSRLMQQLNRKTNHYITGSGFFLTVVSHPWLHSDPSIGRK